MKQALSMAGIGLLGGLAIAGWMPRATVGTVNAAPAPVAAATSVTTQEPVEVTPAVATDSAAPVFRTIADRRYRYGDNRYDSRYDRNRRYGSYNNGSYGYRNDDRYYGDYRRERSTGKSVAIVGGSAAAGAAIGGLAGGGKGAAIGAIGGGAAGFIYDRMTKNKR